MNIMRQLSCIHLKSVNNAIYTAAIDLRAFLLDLYAGIDFILRSSMLILGETNNISVSQSVHGCVQSGGRKNMYIFPQSGLCLLDVANRHQQSAR